MVGAYHQSMSGSGLRGDDRILTTHVGSLVRPDELVAALRARRSGGDVGDEEFEAILARSVREVVSRQADVGIDVVSDGEFGKTISWSRYILERLSGFEDRPDAPAWQRSVHRAAPGCRHGW